MKTILILLDTVRKDYLPMYNDKTDVCVPNIDALSLDSTIFDNHYTGSLPCMPARRDIMTGRLDFLERLWGGLEPFDTVLQKELSLNGCKTHICTDHQHYFKFGGEGYVQYFDTYDFFRGQESDGWVSSIDNYHEPVSVHGRFNKQFLLNSSKFNDVSDYPTVQTFNAAMDFVSLNKDCDDFFIQVEGFDPHEPFLSPKEFMDMYGVSEEDISEYYNSPKYGKLNDTKEQLDFITKKYKANLSFADYALGNLINKLKALGIYDECNIIFTSDHGFHLGEHGYMGKGVTHIYNEVSAIPLMIKFANQKSAYRYGGLTQNVDLYPTVCDLHNVDIDYEIHGESLINCRESELDRKAIISGYHGSSVMVTDGANTLFNAPGNIDNHPLYNYTAIPTMIKGYLGSKYSLFKIDPKTITCDRYLGHTDYPVFRFPMSAKGFKNPMIGEIFNDELYANTDKLQLFKIEDTELISEYKQLLKMCLEKYNAPSEQYIRLGLKKGV